jgi:hypothetical protein
MRKFFSLQWLKREEMEDTEGKLDCATRIAQHKLTVYKIGLPLHNRPHPPIKI